MEVESSNPVTVPCFFLFIFLFYICIIYRYNCLNIIHCHFKTIWAAEYRFNDNKNAYPTELMHPMPFRI